MAHSDANIKSWNVKCLLAITLVSLCPFQHGVDLGIIGGLQAMPGFLNVFGYHDPKLPGGWNITPKRQRLISSLITLGAIIASGCAGPLSWRMGRKVNIWIACGLGIVANTVMITTTSIGALYVARFILGISNGMLLIFANLYIHEASPAMHRGMAQSAFQTWTSIGTMVGTIVDNFTAPIAGRKSYIIPLGIVYIVPVIIALGLLFIPESPRWLAEKGRLEAAQSSMRWLRATDKLADAEVQEISQSLQAEKQLHASVSILDMFSNPVDRRRSLVSIAAINTQSASGAMFILVYGTYFFRMAKVGKPFENSVILVSIGVFAIIMNTVFITRFGRRRIFLMTGLSLCGLFQLIIAVIFTARPDSRSAQRALVGLTCLYIVSFNALISSYAWLVGGEAPSQRLRSYTFGLGTALSLSAGWLVTFTAPYFINPAALNWGPKYGYIWAPSCVIGAVFTWWFIPETKGRTLEEINEMFEARVPAREFSTYRCVGAAASVDGTKDGKCSDDEKGSGDEGSPRTEVLSLGKDGK